MIDVNLNELRDVCQELETANVYSLRNDTLRSWAAKIHMIRQQLESYKLGLEGCSSRGVVNRNTSGSGKFGLSTLRLGETPAPDGQKASMTQFQRNKASEKFAQSARSIRLLDAPHPGASSSVSVSPTFAAHVSSATHLIVDNLCHMVQADWTTCFVYNEPLKKLLLVAGAGQKAMKPGEISISASSGLESTVMENGVAVGIGMPAVEDELMSELEANGRAANKSRCVLCFPLFKPGSTTNVIGVLQAGKISAQSRPFSGEDENRFAECAFLLASLVDRFSSDLTNPNTLDASIFNKPSDATERHLLHASCRHPQLIYRTGFQHPRKADVMREAQQLSRAATVQNVMEHTSFVSEAWRSSVLLNIELEHEVRRLHEALRVSRREVARLQAVLTERKGGKVGTT
jgi:hypothetical protein